MKSYLNESMENTKSFEILNSGSSNSSESSYNIPEKTNPEVNNRWKLTDQEQKGYFNNHYSINHYYHHDKTKQYDRKFQYYSAGVLPFSKDSGGNVYFLLGKDKEGNWSDFGGRSEHTDAGNYSKTASRELYEETMGSVMSLESGFKMLTLPNFQTRRTLITSKTLGGSPYYMYLLEIHYADYKKNFKRTHDYVKYVGHKFIEKTDIRWVSLETIIGATDKDLENEDVLVPLRPIFRQTLRNHINEINNTVSNISNIL
tara:strand:+ start:6584 stop:7357 length:774 start_codon:yes stop_codon:yes gene_type:complete